MVQNQVKDQVLNKRYNYSIDSIKIMSVCFEVEMWSPAKG